MLLWPRGLTAGPADAAPGGLRHRLMADPSPTEAPEREASPFGRRVSLRGRTMRQHAARGTVVNAFFSIGLATLGLLKGVVVAAFLAPSEYGVWGILMISLLTVTWLKQAGVGDKYIQQSEPDQELAFQRAFTLELVLSGAVALLFVLVLPLLAALYGRGELIAPGLVMALAMAVSALQAPAWVYYRRMDFVRQRTLQAVDPLVGFAVTLGLAIAGAGYWSLVAGVAAGAAAGALAALLASPYRLALRYERRASQEYVTFSWPLMVAGGSSIVIAQGSIIAGESELGLAGAGAITLAAMIAQYTDRVDAVVTSTLYPAICAVRDRTDLLFEAFVKSNRLALMWGVPFGVGLTLFAADLVDQVFGREWDNATILLQVFGVAAALGHIGFNWDAFYRARGDTRPVAVWSALTMVSFLAVPLPLLLTEGMTGFAIGIAAMTAVSLAIRCFYLVRLFSGFRLPGHAARALAPTLAAVGVVLAVRGLGGLDRTPAVAVGELGLFVLVTAAATIAVERALLREVAGYLRGGPRPRPAF